jgi:hypothetical protein
MCREEMEPAMESCFCDILRTWIVGVFGIGRLMLATKRIIVMKMSKS